MFFNLKVCLATCYCTLKEIKVGSREFSQLLPMVSHDLWDLNPRPWIGWLKCQCSISLRGNSK